MKMNRLWSLTILSVSMAANAQTQQKLKIESFLSNDQLPDVVLFLPNPPSDDSPEYANDLYYYHWGKAQRDTPAGRQAAIDECAWTSTAFSPAVGFTISPNETPEIFKLVEGARKSANETNKRAKNHYMRIRPFSKFNEPSLVPEYDDEERTTYSYPSSHSVRGWVYAMTLAVCIPDSTEALMLRARKYAMNRVICGRHYKSDVDASHIVATAVFCKLMSNPAFQKQLKKARKEYKHIRKKQAKQLPISKHLQPTADIKDVTINPQRHFIKTVPAGNYSGITWLGGSQYAVVNDKSATAGFHLMTINTDSVTGVILSVQADSVITDGHPSRDEEGICYVPQTNTLFISGEKDGRIVEHDTYGRLTGRELTVPEVFKTAYHNASMEALTYNANTHRFWTTSENTLRNDGKKPTLTNMLNNRLRLQSFNDNLLPAEQYWYESDATVVKKKKGESVLGVSGMAALNDGRIVVLERELYFPKKKIGSFAHIKLYVVTPSLQQPGELLTKTFLAEFRTKINLTKRSFANYEGICAGPILADGKQLLVLVCDSQNQNRGLLKDWFKTIVIK